jgi:hypothetical protein
LLFGGKKMKKSLLLSGLLLVAMASSALAAPGTNLRWSNCFGDVGAQNRTSVCTSSLGNAGSLVGSFEMPSLLAGVTGVELSLDLAVAGASLPAWWTFTAAGCRPGALTMNAAISGSAANCFDWASGAAAGGLAAYNEGFWGPSSAHILGGFAVPAAFAANLEPGAEYFAFNAVLSNTKTTSTGSCAGCLSGACIVFNSIKVAVPPVAGQPDGSILITGSANPASNYALWQGGAGVSTLLGQGCPGATPTRNTTWSKVKSLYN